MMNREKKRGTPNSNSANSLLIQDNQIEVLCGCDERYLRHAATMLCSLLEHNSVSRIHIFYSGVAGVELVSLRSFVANYGSELVCHEMAAQDFRDLRVDKGSSLSSIANYFRLLAPRVLPSNISKILYLDSDIIVRRSLRDLWSVDLRDHALAAVECSYWDPKEDFFVKLPSGAKYFNSGVLLINLDYWRQNNVYERTVAFVKEYPERVNLYDQDALNAILAFCWISLPAIWNEQARSKLSRPALRDKHVLDPAIVHFVGFDKPWYWSCNHPFRYEYHKYRRKTPWWQYKLQDKPSLPQRLIYYLRYFARMVLPGSLRQWLRLRVVTSRA